MGWSGGLLSDARKRWRAGLLLIFAINLFGLHFLLTPEDMTTGQENHDTRIMYKHLRYWNQPTKWLFGDWPLQNGFYRPLPTLAFEADRALWDNDFPKYKIFNWIVGVFSVFALVAFVLSLTQSTTLALLTGVLFSAWQTDFSAMLPMNWIATGGAILCLVTVFLSPKESKGRWLMLSALIFYLGYEWANLVSGGDLSAQTFGYRAMGWPPGRTATLFGLFGLISLWGYCQWERWQSTRWLLICLIGFVGAFMSYEQAVMLPALLLACAIYLRLTGARVHWALHLVAWSLMALYAWWHLRSLPIETTYVRQHESSIWSGSRSLILWVFPAYGSYTDIEDLFDPNIGLFAIILSTFWIACLWMIVNVLVWITARKEWKLLVLGLLGSAVVFAPMAFQLRLTHYLYMPLALRAIFVATLTLFAWRLLRDLLFNRASHAIQEKGQNSVLVAIAK